MANALRQIVRVGMATLLPRRRFIVSGPASGSCVCLTFDDGPHPEHTPRLLDVLDELRVKATFFMIGREVEKHPEIVKRVAAAGHAVGGHSFFHSEPGATSAAQLADEVERTERLFEDLLGRRTKLFRPPHGKLTAGKTLKLMQGGQSVILWNVDPKDFACGGAAELSRKFRGDQLRGGDIVLLHDNHPHAACALPGVLESARGRGLAFHTVCDWLK